MTAGTTDTDAQARDAFAASIRASFDDGATVSRQCWSDPDAWRPPWQRACALDLPGLVAPAVSGGSAANVIDLCVALDAIGRTLAPIPLLATAGYCVPLLAATDNAAIGDSLHRLLDTGGVAAHVRVARDFACIGDICSELPRADLVVIDLGDEVLVCQPDEVQSDRALIETVDPASPVGRIDPMLIRAMPGLRATLPPPTVAAARAAGRCAAAAELTGLSRRAIDAGVRHANFREQFGRPIATFQGVKHALAAACVKIERAHGLWELAAGLLDDDLTDLAEAQAVSHLAAGAAVEAAVAAAHSSLRVHGAMGVTWEHDAHLLLRRVRNRTQRLGRADTHFANGARGLWGQA